MKASEEAASTMMATDRRLKELLMLMLIDVLRREDGAKGVNGDEESADNVNGDAIEGIERESRPLDDQSAISKELLIIAQRLIDARLLDTLGANDGQPTDKSPATASSIKLWMYDNEASANNSKKKAVTKKKKKKNKRNRRKAAAKHKQNKLMSLGSAGLIPNMVMMAFSIITMLIASLSLSHQSDASGEGNMSPALQPTTSQSLLRHGQSDYRLSNTDASNAASTSSYININTFSSPLAAVTPPPVVSPAAGRVGNRHLKFDEKDLSTCLDTPNWQDEFGYGCDWYEENDEAGCPNYGIRDLMGLATDHCCHCGGGLRTCEDFQSKCQKYLVLLGIKDGILTPLCDEAESCSCEDGRSDFKVVDVKSRKATVGLYSQCKCDFWSRICDDSGQGAACDYAAEYCCGDYSVVNYDDAGVKDFSYIDSPTCYCDFFTYAQNKFEHTLKPIALNLTSEIPSPCRELETEWITGPDSKNDEMQSLMTIYVNTKGQNWKNNAGWMSHAVPHCQWYGITCDEDGRVSGIDLRDNNLVGQFPEYSRDIEPWLDSEYDWRNTNHGLANLYYLKTLYLAHNKLTGTINYRPLYNLHLLYHFDISGNQLSGEVNALVTPSIAYANFSNNRFVSMNRFEPYKVSPLQTLRSCDISNNVIKVDATDLLLNIPLNVGQFMAANNDIHGNIPATLKLPQLRQFDMSFNALSGTLPEIEGSSLSLQEFDLSNQKNGLSGPIPEELWKSQSLKRLNLAGNKLTGTISSKIAMWLLKEWDMSNNSLSGQIPSQIGFLGGTLHYLDLSNNVFSGVIPAQLGKLRDASVFLEGNSFDSQASCPLSLCRLVRVEELDIADDNTFCPIERNALSDFYDSAKGTEWTNNTNWMDEYLSHCEWKGVKCIDDRVIELNLASNGLSGRLSERIGDLTFMEVLDLSNNWIKGPIPYEVGLLSNLTYLRLSYNAFTGDAPESLGNLEQLQLLQMNSNRITAMPNISRLDNSIYGESTFITDCGVPSAFESALECENCTMCCNANEACYPQEETQVGEWGLNYGTFAAVLLACFILLCCVVVLCIYRLHKKNRENASSLTMSNHSVEEDDDYALSMIGKDSVYSYFVTDMVFGWIVAFVTLGAQAGLYTFFIFASEANLQNSAIDIQFTWKCPLDSDNCTDKSDLTAVGWVIFCVLMVAFLAKDMISGIKLIHHSSRIRHPFWSRIRYFIGGLGLCLITLFALYVSTVYNHAIATSNTDIILHAFVVLFVTSMDKYIFAALEASNNKFTAHATSRKAGTGDSTVIAEMKKKTQLILQKKWIERQSEEIAFLREAVAVQKRQESQAASAIVSESIPLCAVTASESMSWDATEESRSETAQGRGGVLNETKDETK